jgi:hypothetical protein
LPQTQVTLIGKSKPIDDDQWEKHDFFILCMTMETGGPSGRTRGRDAAPSSG